MKYIDTMLYINQLPILLVIITEVNFEIREIIIMNYVQPMMEE